MRNATRLKFNAMTAAMALTYGVPSVAENFAATPTIEQRLMDKIVESIAFLQQINIVPVDEMEGEKILGSVTGAPGKRTDTTNNDRQTSDPLNLDPHGYKCVFTEYDVHMKYATIDAWAKFPNLHEKFMGYVRLAQAHSSIRTGWHGLTAAAVTNSGANPLGEDTNIGWLQHIRAYNGGSQMMSQGEVADEIRIGEGAGADYPNLDAMVQDVKQLVHPLHRQAGDLVAIVGDDLTSMDKAQLYQAQGQTPTEKEKIELASITRTYAGLPTHQIPFFPSTGILVTSFKNLSIYHQQGTIRQHVIDNPKRSRVEHYNSTNEAYVVEDVEKTGAIEFANVKFWSGDAWV
ncbi:MAG: phage major capsid protein, P2 family [Gammaproteobacteria bacterium]|nr:phage major capsid protein, P2 family [Gammaproteobacteria bacterium]